MANHILELGVFEVNGNENLRFAGRAKHDGCELRLMVDKTTGEMVVYCPVTETRFRLRWQDVVEIAINQGVHVPAGDRH